MAAALLALATLAALVALPATPATAVSSTGHGRGHLWKGDGFSWLGSYRLDDGRFAFCLEVGKPSPVGNDYATTTSEELPGLPSAQVAKLAYIARTWAAAPDDDTAAAGQLAVWSLTGLAGQTLEHYAQRANERADVVLQRARQMLAEADERATLSVRAEIKLSVRDDGGAIVRADVLTNRVGSGATLVPDGLHTGSLSLAGATFADGTTRAEIPNGRRVTVLPRTSGSVVRVRADVTYSGLPYGRAVTVGRSPAGSQALLFSAQGTVARGATDTSETISPRPFQPRVVTTTSSAVASAGAMLTDRLDVGVEPGDGLLDVWGIHGDVTERRPVPVTVRSRLLGPLPEAPVESAEWPDDAPVVCEVATVVDNGPGSYETTACRLPSSGHFVWVETISPDDTPVDQGRDRLRPWRSPFGVATETTEVKEVLTPSISTRAETAEAEIGACVADGLEVSGAGGASFDVESVLVGPLPEPVADGDDLGDRFETLPVAGTVTTTVDGDGSVTTPCLPLTEDGHYVFVFRSNGSAPDAQGHQVVGPFSDLVAHRSEMVDVRRPDEPTPPPSTPPVVPPTTPATSPPPTVPALAFTGTDGVGLTLLGGLGTAGLGASALLGSALVRRIRGIRSRSAASALPNGDAMGLGRNAEGDA
ncbi:hypothetical protein AS850_01845 [Frondihabitans sp. 762G35]|uniref:Cys-Gln thioester bond-forming surface protein n=1 Tax=Frondihabitans sp. 762G35 TaxID=1446794 RepID=UPI000D200876|nr:Cys-Gln thioester bond-forming surface protein [Frondihabitans sp. 762G35]ARC55820.1 hypothetical protein AS850_01845 [Frondihabitans sp. 762G35]